MDPVDIVEVIIVLSQTGICDRTINHRITDDLVAAAHFDPLQEQIP